MKKYLQMLPTFVDRIREIREIIISNILLIGQVPAPTFHERKRAACLVERLSDFNVDECVIDDFGNPIGVIRGSGEGDDAIFITAHLDTFSEIQTELNYEVTDKVIKGVGVSDNSAAVGVLASLPEIFRHLGLTFRSDIVLVAPNQSLGRGNLRGIRQLIQAWPSGIRNALCLESVELGRLNYHSSAMIRGEIDCSIASEKKLGRHYTPNAILVINEVINAILSLRLPQKPRTKIVIGKIAGGFNHGRIAYDAKIGFEIRSDSDTMVTDLYKDIGDITEGVRKTFGVEMKLNRISNLSATQLPHNHPLVKCGSEVLKRLGVAVVSEPSETALSIFLQDHIPAITLGLTRGDNYHQNGSMIEIEPMFKGIAQIPALLMAIDNGACDG